MKKIIIAGITSVLVGVSCVFLNKKTVTATTVNPPIQYNDNNVQNITVQCTSSDASLNWIAQGADWENGKATLHTTGTINSTSKQNLSVFANIHGIGSIAVEKTGSFVTKGFHALTPQQSTTDITGEIAEVAQDAKAGHLIHTFLLSHTDGKTFNLYFENIIPGTKPILVAATNY